MFWISAGRPRLPLAAQILDLLEQIGSQSAVRLGSEKLLRNLATSPAKLGIAFSSVVALYSHSALPLRLAASNASDPSIGLEFPTPQALGDWLENTCHRAVRSAVIQFPLESYGNHLGILALCPTRNLKDQEVEALQALTNHFADMVYLQQLVDQTVVQKQLPEHAAETLLRSISNASVDVASDARIVQHILTVIHQSVAFDIGALYSCSPARGLCPLASFKQTVKRQKRFAPIH